MTDKVRVSVAMATYNGGKYLREQLDSILAQTIQDLEIVVTDDCSTDNTWDILQEYANKDKRFRIYRNEKNLGFKKNFEKVIGLCKGEFIALSDQDDIWLPHHISFLLENIGDKMIACGNAELMNSDGELMGITLDYSEALDRLPKDEMERAMTILLFRSPYQGASMLIKREFFDKALPVPDGANYHDAWFSALSCFYGGMNYSTEIIEHYRRHGGNVTAQKRMRQRKFRAFVSHTLRERGLEDRKYMIEAIRERVDALTEEQTTVLQAVADYYRRKKSFFTRIINAFFELRNYMIIYACDNKHWI